MAQARPWPKVGGGRQSVLQESRPEILIKLLGIFHFIPERLMDVHARIESQLKENPVMLYMKGTPTFPQCGFSARAVQILGESGVPFAHVNIFEDPELREGLKTYANWPTFPQLYIDGELIGGSDIMMELFESGELAARLKAVAEKT